MGRWEPRSERNSNTSLKRCLTLWGQLIKHTNTPSVAIIRCYWNYFYRAVESTLLSAPPLGLILGLIQDYTYTGTYLVSGMFVATQHVCSSAGELENPRLCKWLFSRRVAAAAGVTWVIGYSDQGVQGQLHPPRGLDCVCYTSWPTIL